MDLSQDFYNDMQTTAPESGALTASESDALQDRDAVLSALKSVNKELADLNANIKKVTDSNTAIDADIRSALNKKAKEAINSFSAAMQKETEEATKSFSEVITSINQESERAVNRIKRAENVMVMPERTAYIIGILLVVSLSFYAVMVALNVTCFHSPFVTSLLLVFAAVAAMLIVVVVLFFHFWRNKD